MNATIIALPAHFTTADTCDIERELVGLIYAARPAVEGKRINVTGIRNPLVYTSPNDTRWASVKHSKVLRTLSVALVRWEVANA